MYNDYMGKAWDVWYEKRRALVQDLKKKSCMDCGNSFPPVCMDFDHRNPAEKIDQISELIARVSLKRLLEEIAKCDLICANCHRIRTQKRQEIVCKDCMVRLYLENMDWIWVEEKMGLAICDPCWEKSFKLL